MDRAAGGIVRVTQPSETSGNVPHLKTRIGITRAEADAANLANLPGHLGDPAEVAPLDPARAIVEAFKTLTDLPFVGEKILAKLEQIRTTLDLAFGQQVWTNASDVSNQAGVTYGAGATLPVFNNPSQWMGCVLRNINVGASVGAVVQLVAARTAPQQALIFGAPQGVRVLGTVRPQASMLTVQFPGTLVLLPGEVLHLISTAAASLDFSCDYRVLASE